MIHSKFMPNKVILYADNNRSQKLLKKQGVDVIQVTSAITFAQSLICLTDWWHENRW